MLAVVGPRRHGVVEFGLELAEAMRCNDSHVVSTHVEDPRRLDPPRQGIHLQFTDRLFGATPTGAAAAVRAVVVNAAARGFRVTATLHDVPQASDGEHFAYRAEAYATVCAALDGVVVNSCHEMLLLSEIGITPQHVAAIPLPVRVGRATRPMPTASESPSVGVFGFLYPGKGHLDVMAALEGLDPGIGMVAIGEPSAGHEHLQTDLQDMGRRQGRSVSVTGHVPEAELHQGLRAVTVPVAHHRHVSASGSLNAWLAAGRRPLTPANRYTVEMNERNPGAFVLYDDDDTALREAIRRALADPGRTWVPSGLVAVPSAADAAKQYEQLFRRWHR